jgi:hypothetical protein
MPMDPKPPVRRRHPAARSRVVAGALSAVLFLGLGAGMAANQATTATVSAAGSGTAGSQEDGGSSSGSWAATPGSSSDQSPMTSSQGS